MTHTCILSSFPFHVFSEYDSNKQWITFPGFPFPGFRNDYYGTDPPIGRDGMKEHEHE